MAQQEHRQVELEAVEAVQVEFMHPNEGIFAHLLDIIHALTYGADVCSQLSTLLGATAGSVPLTELNAGLRHISTEDVAKTLSALSDQHILSRTQTGNWPIYQLAVWTLVGRKPDIDVKGLLNYFDQTEGTEAMLLCPLPGS